MKRTTRKLALHKESIRLLSDLDATVARGGVQHSVLNMCPDTFGCPVTASDCITHDGGGTCPTGWPDPPPA